MSKLLGVYELRLAMAVAEVEIEKEVKAILREHGEIIATNAKKICPVDTGTLRSTIQAQEVVKEGHEIVEDITCGGPAAPYAIYVHERLAAHHNPPTQAKFLERPALEEKLPLMRDLSSALIAWAETGGKK